MILKRYPHIEKVSTNTRTIKMQKTNKEEGLNLLLKSPKINLNQLHAL
jgi:hypothetical protein